MTEPTYLYLQLETVAMFVSNFHMHPAIRDFYDEHIEALEGSIAVLQYFIDFGLAADDLLGDLWVDGERDFIEDSDNITSAFLSEKWEPGFLPDPKEFIRDLGVSDYVPTASN